MAAYDLQASLELALEEAPVPREGVDEHAALLQQGILGASTLAEVDSRKRQGLDLAASEQKRLKLEQADLAKQAKRLWTEDFQAEGPHPFDIVGADKPARIFAKYGVFLQKFLTSEADMAHFRRELTTWRAAHEAGGVEVCDELQQLADCGNHLDVLGEDFASFAEALQAALSYVDSKLRSSVVEVGSDSD